MLNNAPTNVSTYAANTKNNDKPMIMFEAKNNVNASNDEACLEIPPRHLIVCCGPRGPMGNL